MPAVTVNADVVYRAAPLSSRGSAKRGKFPRCFRGKAPAIRRDERLIRAVFSPFWSENPALRTGVNFALGKPDVPG